MCHPYLSNSYDALNLTHLDLLDGLAEIRVAIAYKVARGIIESRSFGQGQQCSSNNNGPRPQGGAPPAVGGSRGGVRRASNAQLGAYACLLHEFYVHRWDGCAPALNRRSSQKTGEGGLWKCHVFFQLRGQQRAPGASRMSKHCLKSDKLEPWQQVHGQPVILTDLNAESVELLPQIVEEWQVEEDAEMED
ncbi:hypothetical protein C8R44DRAFT_754679 [Mycena epipterygia]|nr:hypothetical protein C8R44DRAFT_754679 [Mycena epipterygia]